MKKMQLIYAGTLAALLAACGGNEKPPAASGTDAGAPAPAAPVVVPAPAAVPAAPPVAAAGAAGGEGVYTRVCSLCHASGLAGAPMFGDKAAWEPRITQGSAILYKHAIEGFAGAKGMMPPRGGNASLTDDEVKSAVDYMVAKAR